MKFCQPHWDKLKTALVERGLEPLMVKTSEAMHRRMQVELRGDAHPADMFEPLMGAHNAILANALSAGGLALMAPKDDGSDWCPICFLKTCECGDPACPERFESWVEKAADEQLAQAHALKLIETH